MAEEFFDFLEATDVSNSFGDFEKMWLEIGDQLEAQAYSKRPLSPSPENQVDCDIFAPVANAPAVSYSKAPSFDEGRFNHVEDSVLTNLRRTNHVKIQQLEKRMSTPGKGAVSEFKEQFDLIRSLMTRIEQDYAQIKIILNFLADSMEKKKSCVKRVKFSNL